MVDFWAKGKNLIRAGSNAVVPWVQQNVTPYVRGAGDVINITTDDALDLIYGNKSAGERASEFAKNVGSKAKANFAQTGEEFAQLGTKGRLGSLFKGGKKVSGKGLAGLALADALIWYPTIAGSAYLLNQRIPDFKNKMAMNTLRYPEWYTDADKEEIRARANNNIYGIGNSPLSAFTSDNSINPDDPSNYSNPKDFPYSSNQRAVAGSTTNGLGTYGYTNSQDVVSAVNGAYNVAQNNIQSPQGFGDASGVTMDVLQRMGALGNVIKGAQSGYALPYIGTTPEEAQAYRDALEQIGRNISAQRIAPQSIQKAIDADDRARRNAYALNALGNALSSLGRRPYIQVDTSTGQLSTVDLGGQQLPIDFGDTYANIYGGNLERLANQQKLATAVTEQQNNYLKDLAKLQSNIRTSQVTGLPLAVVQNMEAKDYVNYLEPMQKTSGELTVEGAKAMANLLGNEQQSQADFGLQQLKEMGATDRAKIANLADIAIANMNNDTKMQIARQLGINAQQLEQLKWHDPYGYLKAVSGILQAGAMLGDPTATDFFRQISANVYQNILGGGNNTTALRGSGLRTDQANYFTGD